MSVFRVGIIGCGERGKYHAYAYAISEDAEIVACADPKHENAEIIAKTHNIPESSIYADYKEMLAKEKPDIVSICTWPGLHAQMVIDSAGAGVKAIHVEKPMASTWDDAKKLYKVCVDNNVMITVCHQRRFSAPFIKAKQLVDAGVIGELYRVEGYCPDLFDWGTHWFDMFFFYNDDKPAEWVIGQTNWEVAQSVYGVPVETDGISYVKWENDVYGLLVTGCTTGGRCSNRLIGTKGMIEVQTPGDPSVRVMHEGSVWETPNFDSVVPRGDDTVLSVLDLIDCLKTGRESVLSGRKALQATELIFSTYESSRRGSRIYLPLNINEPSGFNIGVKRE